MNTLEGIAQRRPFHRVVKGLWDAEVTYLHQLFQLLSNCTKVPTRDVQTIQFGSLADPAPFPFCKSGSSCQ